MTFRKQTIIGNLFLVAASLLLASCGGGSSQGRPGQGQQVQSYPVLDLHPRSIVLTNSYPATLEGFQTVEIRPRVQGYIVDMPVDEGDVVKEDEVLFRINSEQYEQEVRSAEADVEAAKAAVQTAEDEVQRTRNLVEQDIISDYQLQSAKNNLQSQKAKLSQAQARLTNAKVNLGYTYVKSPTDGIIGNIPYRIGSLVGSTITKPLTVVSDISKMYAYFSMSERELLDMARTVADEGGHKTLQQRIEDMPKVNLILPDSSVYNYKGSLRLASGLINTQTGSASFRAIFPNPEEILRSGGSGSIQIPFSEDSVIVVPKKSTYEIQNKTFVYALTDSNTVQSREIQTLSLSAKRLYVVKSGLSDDSKIILQSMGNLRDGTRIEPEPVNNDSLYQKLTKQDQNRDI